MPSKTDACNEALALIGEAAIANIDDNLPNNNVCRTFYSSTYDALLRDHVWNHAYARRELAPDSTAPAFGFTASYTLPDDCVRVCLVNGQFPWVDPGTQVSIVASGAYYPPTLCSWKIEGRKILTNAGQCLLEYISNSAKDDPTIWDALFYQVFAMMLASRIAGPIAGKLEDAANLAKMANEKLLQAKAVDGQESSPPVIQVLDLINVRTG